MKKLIFFTTLVLLLSVLGTSFPTEQTTKAATTQFIQAKNDIILRDAPNQQANQIAKIKNHSQIVVHSKENEWAHVEHSGKKGYIYASTLTKKKPTGSKVPPLITKGLLPKVGHSYTYEPSFENSTRKTYKALKNPYLENSVELLESEYTGYTYIESEKNFQLGVAYSDVFFFSLSYPMKEKKTTLDTDYDYDKTTETNVSVESTSTTLIMKAGTFHNVIVLKYPNGSKLYLAKDYGVIRITDPKGKITTELISVKKTH